MNIVTVPPSPNWYEVNILACSPDNTLIYGARNDLIIVENYASADESPNVRIITRAHSQRIISVDINRNWGKPRKLAVSVSDDKRIKVWDVASGKKHAVHNKHLTDNKVIGASFAGEDRVISVSEDGKIIIWNIPVNETIILKDIFGMKVCVSCMSICPHATWLVAFGMKTGLVIVADLRKNGKVLYKLRGHDKSVVALSWCPVPVNIFPRDPKNIVGQKNEQDESEEVLKNKQNDSKAFSNTEAAVEILVSSKLGEQVEAEDTTNENRNSVDNACENKLICEIKQDSNVINVQENDTECNLKGEATTDIKNTKLETTHYKNGSDTDSQNDNSKDNVTLEPNNQTETANIDKEILVVTEDIDNEVVIKLSENTNENAESNVLTANKTEDSTVGDAEMLETCQKVNLNSTESLVESETIIEGIDSDTNLVINTEIVANTDKNLSKEIIDIEKQPAADSESVNVQEASSTDHKIDDNDVNTNICREIGKNSKKVVSEEEPRKEFLLASSGREQNIYIWRAGTDGRMQTFLTMPSKPFKKSQADKIWITLCWITPTVLLSSSKNSELLAWTLPKPHDNSKYFTVVHNDHSSLLFSISTHVALLNQYNWKEGETSTNVWTTSQDRLLLNTSIDKDRKNLACLPTLGGCAACLQLSPLDPNRLAIGTTDGFLKIWDLSRPHRKHISMISFHQKILSKVSAIAYHPINESILAFGTAEGRVGYVDPNNKSKAPILLRQHFTSEIYQLQWAPLFGLENNFGLFALSAGNIVYFDLNKKDKGPNEICKPDDTFIYALAWKPDYSIMVAVAKAGYLILYCPNLKIMCKHYFKYRLLQIVWHPNSCDINSDQHNWFAAVSNLKSVVIYKFDIDSGNNDENIVNLYQTGSSLVHTVAWSPHDPNQLLIGCDIGIIRIWDVRTNKTVATFVNKNYETIISAIWSPLDPNYIISGGRDNMLKIWSILDYPPKDEKEIIQNRKKYIKETSSDIPNRTVNSDDSSMKGSKAKTSLLPSFYSPTNIAESVSDLKKLLAWKENQDNDSILLSSTNNFFNVFRPDSAMMNLVIENEMILKGRGKHTLSTTLSLFRGDISTCIKEAIKEKRVDLRILSIATMVSPKLWSLACEAYADQLVEQSNSDPVDIATYYLACHKVERAVTILCDAQMFREAITLAKCRMLGEDFVNEILLKWATQTRNDGNFEVAAQCYIALGKYDDAASILFRRSDLEVLEFAVELAEKSGNEELHNAALYKYNECKLSESVQLPSRQEAFLQRNDVDINNKTENMKENGADKNDTSETIGSLDTNMPQTQKHDVGSSSKDEISVDQLETGEKNTNTHDNDQTRKDDTSLDKTDEIKQIHGVSDVHTEVSNVSQKHNFHPCTSADEKISLQQIENNNTDASIIELTLNGISAYDFMKRHGFTEVFNDEQTRKDGTEETVQILGALVGDSLKHTEVPDKLTTCDGEHSEKKLIVENNIPVIVLTSNDNSVSESTGKGNEKEESH